ncbi:DUF6338 family protein [Streptomyces sp. NPDC007107]|uniref:DUF6338 family protein n=1 Tax=Streptomyces sp. NPDC007107 TaxID=3156915 RepID=UPI0033C37E28
MALSTLAGIYAERKSPRRTGAAVREGTVAVHALTDRAGPGGRHKPFAAVELSDGRLVEGYVRYVSTDPDPARRDIVLQQPIAWTGPGDAARTRSPAVCVFVPGALVRVVHISYPPGGAIARKASAGAGRSTQSHINCRSNSPSDP